MYSFSASSPTLVVFCCLIVAIVVGVRWYLTASPWWLMVLSFSTSACCTPSLFLGEMSIQALCPFKKSDHLTFCYWVVGVICIFCVSVPYQIHDLQIFPPSPWIAFSLCWLCHLMCESCSFWRSPVYRFLLWPPGILVLSPGGHCQVTASLCACVENRSCASVLGSLFCWSVCLFPCQQHTVFLM